MSEKKLRLSKKISSIFQNVPNLEDDMPQYAKSQSFEQEKFPSGRNALIPIQQGFFHSNKQLFKSSASFRCVIDIGSTSIKWLCVRNAKVKSGKIAAIAYIPIASHFGENQYEEDLKNIFQQIKTKAPFIREVSLVISEPVASFSTLSVAKTNKKNLEQILMAEIIRRNPGWNRDEFITEHVISERPSREMVGALHVTVAQAQKDILELWIKILQSVGWSVLQVEGLPFALESLVQQDVSTRSEQPLAILEMGASHTMLFFFRDGLLEYQRRIPISAGEITLAMQKQILSTEGRLELTAEEAEALKIDVGIPQGMGESKTTLGKTVAHSQVLALIRPVLERLVQEIERSIRFYIKTYQIKTCDQMILFGGGAQLKHLDTYLTQQLKLRQIEQIQPLQKFDQTIEQLDLAACESSFIPCVGLALQKNKKLDLRSKNLRQLHSIRLFHQIFKRVALMLTLTVCALIGTDYVLLKHRKQTLETSQGNLAKLDKAMSRVKTLRFKNAQVEQTVQLYTQVVTIGPQWAYLLKEISNAILEPVYLRTLKIVKADDHWNLTLVGEVMASDDSLEHTLSEFLIRLEAAKSLSHVSLVRSQQKGDSHDFGIEFEIICRVLMGEVSQ
ncbi:MAG: pilus assembly protein PilM [Chlamydiota bacterium]|nr:pilus assembly protein PilM [Chlamydiota bacterium]